MVTSQKTPPVLQTDEEYTAEIDRTLEQIKRLREQMVKDQINIDRLKLETRAILAELKAA